MILCLFWCQNTLLNPFMQCFLPFFLTATSCQDGVYRSPKSVLNSNAFVAQILLIEPTVYFVFSLGKDLHSHWCYNFGLLNLSDQITMRCCMRYVVSCLSAQLHQNLKLKNANAPGPGDGNVWHFENNQNTIIWGSRGWDLLKASYSWPPYHDT